MQPTQFLRPLLGGAVCAVGFAVMFLGTPAVASTWAGGNGNWSSDTSPGWNGTGVPNAQGVIASKTNSAGVTTTVDVGGGVTVGTLSAGGVNNGTWSITLSNKITFDQDGAGPGAATIVNTGSGTSSRISFGAGTITLADDLVISNNSASSASASISASSAIGGAGNLTIWNIANDVSVAPITLTGTSTFNGNVLIEKGAVTFSYSAGSGLGNTANVITLGQAGQGSVTFISTGSAITLANPQIVAGGTGGTTLIGSSSAAAASDSAYTGTLTLNGDATVTSSKASGATVKFSNVISGAGGLTKIGTGSVTLAASNTYLGATTVSTGTLALVSAGSLGSGLLQILGGSTLQLSNANSSIFGVVTNSGTIQLFSSALTWWSNITLNGGSSYLSWGGTNTFKNGLTVNSGVNFTLDAASLLSVQGNYQNLGSSVFSNRYTVASGSRYRSSGGATNQFAGGLSISSGSGFDVTNGQSVISGTITNAGTMTVFNARAIYNGNVVNQGAYVSDPSTNTFNGNFTVGPTATVVAAAGDVYAFGSNFVMQSTNRNFNMSSSQVVFASSTYGITTGTTNHLFDLTGSGALDKGSNWLDISQLATNFSIGTLSIATGNSLQVTGGTANALYVGTLDVGGLGTNLLGAVLDLDVNLYYDEHLAGNAYLGGQTYQFAGWQGFLIPIPEPTSCLAMVAGLALLGVIRRTRIPRV